MLGFGDPNKELKDRRPHRTAMERAAAIRCKRSVVSGPHVTDPGELTLKEYQELHGAADATWAEIKEQQAKDSAAWKDIRTWTGAVWALREDEQRSTDLKRAEYVTRYRPIQTLDGLDPHWGRAYLRDVATSVKEWRVAMAAGKWAP